MNTNNQTNSKDEPVPEDWTSVCAPCGFHESFHAGDMFSECTSCLAGTREGDEMFVNGSKIREKKTTAPTT